MLKFLKSIGSDLAKVGGYIEKGIAAVAPALVDQLATSGARFTHHSSIAPTGTISLSLEARAGAIRA